MLRGPRKAVVDGFSDENYYHSTDKKKRQGLYKDHIKVSTDDNIKLTGQNPFQRTF